jgi:cation transport ATPase
MPWYPTVFKTRAMSFKALSCKVVLTCTHSRAPAQPQVEHASDDSVHSLVDVDSPHISSVPSDYESQEIKTDTQAERIEREEEIKEEVKNVKERAAAKKDAAKEKVKKNADNPVVLSNAVGLAVVGGIVGFGAYRQYVRGELTGKVVAAWAAVIGLFGVGDYYVSQYVTLKRTAIRIFVLIILTDTSSSATPRNRHHSIVFFRFALHFNSVFIQQIRTEILIIWTVPIWLCYFCFLAVPYSKQEGLYPVSVLRRDASISPLLYI